MTKIEADKHSLFSRLLARIFVFISLVLFGYVLKAYQIEVNSGMHTVFFVAAPFVLIQAFLPMNWRAFSMPLAFLVSAYLILLPYTFIGLCALLLLFMLILIPNYSVRIKAVLTLGAAVFLAAAHYYLSRRTEYHEWNLATVIVGSALMFRSIIYLYDVHTQKLDVPWITRLSYFMFPTNIASTLFPIVDFKVFHQGFGGASEMQHYKQGFSYLIRGFFQLFAFRIFYHYFTVLPTNVDGVADLAQLMAVNFILILRVISLFYICIGLLCFFGYSLPPVFHNIFFAFSFSDLWRRINIYWKDFVLKIFYYPLFFRFKKFGTNKAIIYAMLICFIITWQLHSWQWFWLRGDFPLRAVDAVYWLVFGIFVTNAALRQIKRKNLTYDHPTWLLAVNALFVFSAMSVLWSLWQSPTLKDWWRIVHAGLHITSADILQLAGMALTYLILVYVVLTYEKKFRMPVQRQRTGMHFIIRYASYSVLLLLLLGIHEWKPMQRSLREKFNVSTQVLYQNKLNRVDRMTLEKGYYGNLLQVNNFNSPTFEIEDSRTNNWARLFMYSNAAKANAGILGTEIRPNVHAEFKGKPFYSNQWGMRDKEYSLEKPANTYRIAILGASIEMGVGVSQDEIFDNLIEKHFADSLLIQKEGKEHKLEILNFSVSGYQLIQEQYVLQKKALPFKPDLCFIFLHYGIKKRVVENMARMIATGNDLDYDFLRDIKKKSGARDDVSTDYNAERLMPYGDEILEWSFAEIERSCKDAGAQAICVYMPVIGEKEDEAEPKRFAERIAKYNMQLWNVVDVYEGVDEKLLKIEEYDSHPNAEGHRLIAKKLQHLLLERQNEIGLSIQKK